MASISTHITNVQHGIGEVAGPGVQAYSENRIHKSILRIFNHLWKAYPWEQYKEWNQVTLDGSTGKITSTTALADLRDFSDVIAVKRAGTETDVPPLPHNKNPFTLSGGTVQYFTSLPTTDADYATKKLLFYPLASSDSLDICHRIYPTTDLDNTATILYLDDDLIEYGAMMLMLATEDLNQAAHQLAREMYDERFTAIMGLLAAHPIDPRTSSEDRYLQQWSA